MRFTQFLLVALLITGAGVLSGCKKELKIEKNLWKNGGEWNVERLDVTQVSTDPSDNFEETIYNYGTFYFNKDGSGSYRITVDRDVDTGTYTYSNTESQLTLIIENEARVFDMDWEKNDITLSITEKNESDGEMVTYTEKLTLKKK